MLQLAASTRHKTGESRISLISVGPYFALRPLHALCLNPERLPQLHHAHGSGQDDLKVDADVRFHIDCTHLHLICCMAFAVSWNRLYSIAQYRNDKPKAHSSAILPLPMKSRTLIQEHKPSTGTPGRVDQPAVFYSCDASTPIPN